MTILKPGVEQPEWKFLGTCVRCRLTVECVSSEVDFIDFTTDIFSHVYWSAKMVCPTKNCRTKIILYKKAGGE